MSLASQGNWSFPSASKSFFRSHLQGNVKTLTFTLTWNDDIFYPTVSRLEDLGEARAWKVGVRGVLLRPSPFALTLSRFSWTDVILLANLILLTLWLPPHPVRVFCRSKVPVSDTQQAALCHDVYTRFLGLGCCGERRTLTPDTGRTEACGSLQFISFSFL